jgi:hypothetical protein
MQNIKGLQASTLSSGGGVAGIESANLLSDGTDFSTGSRGKSRGSISSSWEDPANWYTDVRRFTEDTNTWWHYVQQLPSVAENVYRWLYFIVKREASNWRNLRLWMYSLAWPSNYIAQSFDLSTWTKSWSLWEAGQGDAIESYIESINDDWYKCYISWRPQAWVWTWLICRAMMLDGTSENYTGDNVSGILLCAWKLFNL